MSAKLINKKIPVLEKEEIQILLHTLGLRKKMKFYEKDKIEDPYRNYFYTSSDTTDYPHIQNLIKKGLMVDSGKGWPDQEGTYFYATEKGIELAKKIAYDLIEKLTRSQKRYQLYLNMGCEESFFEWLKDPYYNKYRKRYGV